MPPAPQSRPKRKTLYNNTTAAVHPATANAIHTTNDRRIDKGRLCCAMGCIPDTAVSNQLTESTEAKFAPERIIV